MEQQITQRGRSHRLRLGRSSQAHQTYHLRFATSCRRPVFHDLFAARAVIRTLQEKERLGHAMTLAFVVMPDHVHWICTLGERVSLSRLVGQTKGRISVRLRGRPGLPRPLWQDGFYDRALRPEEDVMGVARYVVCDPLRQGLVASLDDYPHWDAIWMGAQR